MAEFSEYTPGTPCWVDLMTSDLDQGVAFYRALFGWDRHDLGEQFGGYGFFLKNGKTVAGVGPRMDAQAPIAWTTYVSVRDADATAALVRENGGTVLSEPIDVMTEGRMALFVDPTGARFGVWQPRDHHGAELANEPGSFGWSECQTRDVATATSFYSAVFGWTPKVFEEMGGYTVFENDGRGIGGCMAMSAEVPSEVPPHWLTYFGVEGTDAAVDTVRQEGGSVVVPPMDIPSVGRFAVAADPQGAVFAILTPQPPAAA